ncbi:MAG TPA: FHA domain-containing protein [Gemmataceae bacterium]|jgi:hypothetical protein
MVKCPFCHFDNEDGALFCEQCKSDLGVPEPAMAAPIMAAGIASESAPMAFPADSVEFISENAPVAQPVHEEEIPVAALVSTEPFVPPMAEVAPETPAALPASPSEDEPSFTPEAPAAAEAAAPQAPTVAEPAAVTMPASAILASAGIAPAAPEAPALPAEAQPRLLVLRGQKRNVEYPIYEGMNFVGRADEKPVDIDLEDQEPPDRIWCSRQHALIALEESKLSIEDLNSANGTFVNRARIYPGQKRALAVNDVIQIGNVQLKVII